MIFHSVTLLSMQIQPILFIDMSALFKTLQMSKSAQACYENNLSLTRYVYMGRLYIWWKSSRYCDKAHITAQNVINFITIIPVKASDVYMIRRKRKRYVTFWKSSGQEFSFKILSKNKSKMLLDSLRITYFWFLVSPHIW